MKRPAWLLIALAVALPALPAPGQAQKQSHWPARLAKEAGRTAVTFVEPWRRPADSLKLYIIAASWFADAGTTHHNLVGHPGAVETNQLILGSRPTNGRFWATLGPPAVAELMFTNWADEGEKTETTTFWRHAPGWWATFGFSVVPATDAIVNLRRGSLERGEKPCLREPRFCFLPRSPVWP